MHGKKPLVVPWQTRTPISVRTSGIGRLSRQSLSACLAWYSLVNNQYGCLQCRFGTKNAFVIASVLANNRALRGAMGSPENRIRSLGLTFLAYFYTQLPLLLLNTSADTAVLPLV